jgi:hypothetical protein
MNSAQPVLLRLNIPGPPKTFSAGLHLAPASDAERMLVIWMTARNLQNKGGGEDDVPLAGAFSTT